MPESSFEGTKFEFYRELRHIFQESARESNHNMTERISQIQQSVEKRLDMTEANQSEINRRVLEKLDSLTSSHAELNERSKNAKDTEKAEKERLDNLEASVDRISNIQWWLIGILSVGGAGAGVANILANLHP